VEAGAIVVELRPPGDRLECQAGGAIVLWSIAAVCFGLPLLAGSQGLVMLLLLALFAGSVVALVAAVRIDPAAVEARRQAAFEVAAQQDVASRAAEIQRWEAAYRQAHGGEEPPAGYAVGALAVRPRGTNTSAILALVFGIAGGLLGIIFGHIALSQIKRTGEEGRGLAIAGLVLGYIGLAAGIVFIIIGVVASQS
jgi:zinc transporter ZupT